MQQPYLDTLAIIGYKCIISCVFEVWLMMGLDGCYDSAALVSVLLSAA